MSWIFTKCKLFGTTVLDKPAVCEVAKPYRIM